jgi:tetratricopeptide (TPR) repeat protein
MHSLPRRRFCRSLHRCIGLLFTLVLCGPSILFADMAPPSSDFAEATSPPIQTPTALTSGISTLGPEMQGDLLMAHGHYAAAIDSYLHARLTSAEIWNKIGVAYHHLFALDQALRAYQTALTFDPHFSSALNNVAAIYHGRHNYKQAERTYKLAIKYNPKMAVTYCNLGTSYFADAKYKKGMQAYQTAFRLDPNVFSPDHSQVIEEGSSRRQLVVLHYYLAQTYAAAGKNEQALFYLHKSMDEGFNDRKRLMADKAFVSLRTTPEFQHLLAQEGLN